MEFHEVANIFPLMQGKEFENLVEDVRKNGLMEPISTYQGKIIDGRNRFRACQEADVKPRFMEFDGSVPLIDFIVSLNLHRRHLDESQRAMVAARIATMQEGRPKTAQICAVSQMDAAKLLNISRRAVQHANKVQQSGIPELVEAVEAGEIAVSAASQIAAMEPEEQSRVILLPHVAHNSGDNEWYSPTEIIESARKVMGAIDLDPASSAKANEVVGAKTYYDQDTDGLEQDWRGRVWMNPPYASNLVGKFCEKLLLHLSDGIDSAIVLTNNATETRWFQQLASRASGICFPEGRIKFWHPDKPISTPLQGQAIFCFGSSIAREFLEEFQKYGIVWKPVE